VEFPGGEFGPERVYADAGELKFERFGAYLSDLVPRGLGLEDSVIDQTRNCGVKTH
jgi:hypothetical protein